MNPNCLFLPLDSKTVFHHCIFQVITAHFVHHRMLKQALGYSYYKIELSLWVWLVSLSEFFTVGIQETIV